MKVQRHKRKKSYSVLIVSNLDRKSRQFHITRVTLYMLLFLLLIFCTAIGWLIYRSASRRQNTDQLSDRLREELQSQEQLVRQLDEEKNALDQKNLSLEAELAALRQELEEERSKQEALQEELEAQQEAANAGGQDQEPADETALPSLYPSSGTGVLTSTFSEEHPYITFTAETGNNIIAAGDGVVTTISSDDTYAYIIEVSYENDYMTRYLYRQDAELAVEEGAAVSGGDTLLTITADDTEVDYQVLYQNEPVDPLSVIAAKG